MSEGLCDCKNYGSIFYAFLGCEFLKAPSMYYNYRYWVLIYFDCLLCSDGPLIYFLGPPGADIEV
jgi:hypothetical protein